MNERRKTKKEVDGVGKRRKKSEKRQRRREKGAIGARVEETPGVECELARDTRKAKEQDRGEVQGGTAERRVDPEEESSGGCSGATRTERREKERESKTRTRRDRYTIVRRRKGEATRSWSISASKTAEPQRELDKDRRKRREGAKRGPVIFQQRGAQNFNGLSRSGEARAGAGGLRGRICERESEIMRPVNEDQTVKEINPHINMSLEESLSLSFLTGILYY